MSNVSIRCGKVELKGFKHDKKIYETDTYKHLGILQSRQIQHTKIKKQLTTALTTRLQKILKTQLNSKNIRHSITNLRVWHYIVASGAVYCIHHDSELTKAKTTEPDTSSLYTCAVHPAIARSTDCIMATSMSGQKSMVSLGSVCKYMQ